MYIMLVMTKYSVTPVLYQRRQTVSYVRAYIVQYTKRIKLASQKGGKDIPYDNMTLFIT
jgi:hypothetical protein